MCSMLCSVCVSIPVIQSKSVFYLNANKDLLETEKGNIHKFRGVNVKSGTFNHG